MQKMSWLIKENIPYCTLKTKYSALQVLSIAQERQKHGAVTISYSLRT